MAGCSCGTLVDLFEMAYVYPKSEEPKRQAKEFEHLERQFSDQDDEVQVLDPEQDEKEQEKKLQHPFQAGPSSSGSAKDPQEADCQEE